MTTLSRLQEQAHEISSKNGFWDTAAQFYDTPEVLHRDLVTRLALVADEVFESIAVVRGHSFDTAAAERGHYYSQLPPEYGEELADILIRVLDVAEGTGVDLEAEVAAKIEKNQGRPKRHGKNF